MRLSELPRIERYGEVTCRPYVTYNVETTLSFWSSCSLQTRRMTSFGRDKSRLAVEKIGDHLMEEVRKTYPILSDDLLSLLNFIFQGPLLSALDLVEKRSVTRVSSPSGRELFQIIGASGTPYTCFHHLKYCSCPAYHFSVLCKEEHIMCKHVLAMKLSEAMGLTKSLQVSDAEITNMIMAIE